MFYLQRMTHIQGVSKLDDQTETVKYALQNNINSLNKHVLKNVPRLLEEGG